MSLKDNAKAIKALLVDNDLQIIDLLSDALNDIGVTNALSAENGEEGLELFKAENPDIIFCDFMMPIMDGISLLNAVKKIAPKVPFVLYTGYYDEMLLRKLKESAHQPDYTIKKPSLSAKKMLEIMENSFPGVKFGA